MTQDANDWFDIGAYFLIALPGILAAVFTWRIKVRTDRAQLLKVQADLYQLEAGARRVVTRYHPEEGETL